MNKRQIIASLNNIANELDFSGLYKEASSLTNVMIKLSQTVDIQKEIEKLKINSTDSEGLLTKVQNSTDIDELNNLKNQLLSNPTLEKSTMYNIISDIESKIFELEFDAVSKYDQMLSNPYLESNMAKFQAVGQQIENSPEFKKLNEKTKQKIRSYYNNLSSKLKTRVQERGNIPLQNMDTMKAPDQITSFAVQNLQYETNKIINPKVLQPLMQKYLENFTAHQDLSDAERQSKIALLMNRYKVSEREAQGLVEDILDPKNEGIKEYVETAKISATISEIGEAYVNLQKISSAILENAKNYAKTNDKSSISPVPGVIFSTSEFAPLKTITNLNRFIQGKYSTLSKSVSEATKLYNAAKDAYEKVANVIDVFSTQPSWFSLPESQQEMLANRNLYKPIYPGTTPPE